MVVFIRPGPIGMDDDRNRRAFNPGMAPSQFLMYGPATPDPMMGLDNDWRKSEGGGSANAQAKAPSQPEASSHERPLTAGEIQLVQSIFGEGIDYSKVKIHSDSWFFLQPEDTAMTPRGEIYFGEKKYKPDFSKEDDLNKWLFVHEMVHVWQYQMGYPVIANRYPFMNYNYELDENKSLSDYNMEQQGNVLADYFCLKILSMKKIIDRQDGQIQYTQLDIPLYEKILGKFLFDPKNKSNLPPDQSKRKNMIQNEGIS